VDKGIKMKVLKINVDYQKILQETANIILNGGLVVFPSDTVYILAVDPTSEKGVKKLLEFKNRWTGKAISIAVSDKKMATDFVTLNENSENIYKSLLPGPFTIVSEGKHRVTRGIEAENGTLGIRIPDNKYISDLIKILSKPITATSANLSGRTPNYSIQSFLRPLSNKKKEMIDLIVDAGKLPKNKPSTVIDATESEIKILRRGDLITGKSTSLISKSEKETEKIAEFLFKKYLRQKPTVFLLSGDLGCGKTVFSRKIGHILGIKEKITSPTFVIYNEYKIDEEKFLHMDLYKITTERDLEEIKFFDLFSGNTIACIEWPENMGEKNLEKLRKLANLISINFEYIDDKTREIKY
jgi:L-threonylcarbamoyladenylate synthase